MPVDRTRALSFRVRNRSVFFIFIIIEFFHWRADKRTEFNENLLDATPRERARACKPTRRCQISHERGARCNSIFRGAANVWCNGNMKKIKRTRAYLCTSVCNAGTRQGGDMSSRLANRKSIFLFFTAALDCVIPNSQFCTVTTEPRPCVRRNIDVIAGENETKTRAKIIDFFTITSAHTIDLIVLRGRRRVVHASCIIYFTKSSGRKSPSVRVQRRYRAPFTSVFGPPAHTSSPNASNSPIWWYTRTMVYARRNRKIVVHL